MATEKKYYWIKLKESFMTSDTVDYFMSQKNGAKFVVLYQILCLKTMNTDGKLSRKIGEIIIPYDAEKISRDCSWFSVKEIKEALNLYKSFGLVYEDIDGSLVISDYENLIGYETNWANQKRRQRETKKGGHCPPNVHQNVHTDKEIDKEIDIRDKINSCFMGDEKPPNPPTTTNRFKPPTVEEVQEYCRERNNNIDAERFIDYYSSNGWKVGRNSMKDWKAAIRTWERNENGCSEQGQTQKPKECEIKLGGIYL